MATVAAEADAAVTARVAAKAKVRQPGAPKFFVSVML
jgi:hypothetical protein